MTLDIKYCYFSAGLFRSSYCLADRKVRAVVFNLFLIYRTLKIWVQNQHRHILSHHSCAC